MSKTNTSLIIFLFSFIILVTACGGERSISKKKISSSNPSYLNINNDYTSSFIDWQGEAFENIYYSKEKAIKADYPLEVKLKKIKLSKGQKFRTAPLFLLDTTNYNSSGYFAYIENPKYFDELTSEYAHRQLKESKIIGTYKQELLDSGLSYKDIAYILMQFGVIGTYDHLYAEMIISNKEETSDFYEIRYDCVYHFCTNDCYDPKYKFSIRFDKKNREISIMP